ncbi:unnamed protein product [Phytomonas sp. Hart1]|nr:unnamed protein product [Phytomonas sp. Hart1]|eukprot:CCW69734.1 unnamed protein product [Phytomonas sp. isolate Hart1]
MPLIGPYQIPFPFPPYKLQEHAVTELRKFLDAGVEVGASDEPPEPTACGRFDSQSPLGESASTSSPRVVVLESPTGTGKSHILLSSALSHLFSPVYPSTAATGEIAREAKGDPALRASGDAPTAGPPTSLREVLRQRQLEELIAQLKRERKERMKLRRRQLRAATKALAAQAAIPTSHDSPPAKNGAEDFLIPQQRPDVGEGDDCLFTQGAARPGFVPGPRFSRSFSSSSSSASSANSEDATPYRTMEDLSGLIPLRKPKAYFASRTHTQLQQLLDDLRRTDFARFPIRPHPPRGGRPEGRPGGESPPPARALRAVHVGGRQQLCINAPLRRRAARLSASSGEALNEMCLEAMRFEHSASGRALRRRAGGTSRKADALGDIEDLGGGPRASPRGKKKRAARTARRSACMR